MIKVKVFNYLFMAISYILNHYLIFGTAAILIIIALIKVKPDNIKMLFTKRIFKIDKEHNVRDIFEIFVLFLIAIFILLLLLFDGFVLGVLHYQSNSCKSHQLTYYDIQIQTKGAFNILANMTNYTNTEDKLYEYLKTAEKQNLYNVPQKKNGKSRSIPKKYIKSERNPNGIDMELSQKPCFNSANSLFFINSYKNGCKHTDFEHPENSDCYITVDLNGFEPPNKLLEVDIDLNNREIYNKIANGDEIIFVIASREDNSLYPMPSNKYRQLIFKR